MNPVHQPATSIRSGRHCIIQMSSFVGGIAVLIEVTQSDNTHVSLHYLSTGYLF